MWLIMYNCPSTSMYFYNKFKYHVYSDIYDMYQKYEDIIFTTNNRAQQHFAQNFYNISYYKKHIYDLKLVRKFIYSNITLDLSILNI